MPYVSCFRIESIAHRIERFRIYAHRSAYATPPRDTEALVAFLDVDFQCFAGPANTARPDAKRIAFLLDGAAPSLGHRPAVLRSVERDIERCVVHRIAPTAGLVIGREDAAQERDDGQTMASVVADCIDIPPCVAAGWNRRVEARSVISVRAASCPDKAAIGTPAPGWVLPPAQ